MDTEDSLTGMAAVRSTVKSIAWLAEEMGITRGAIHQWGDKVPAERIGEIARITGLSPQRLRPDLFSAASEAAE
jgi:DNA-binding transcriptional regulator YdaS (Cro superfamily)